MAAAPSINSSSGVSVRRVKAFTGAEYRGLRFPVSRLVQRRVWKLLRVILRVPPAVLRTRAQQGPAPQLGLSIILVQEEKKIRLKD